MAIFNLSIMTPESTVYTGEVELLRVPGEKLGNLEVLANHAPLIATLDPGRIILRDASKKTAAFLSSKKSLMEVRNNNAVILLDSLESITSYHAQ